MKKYKTILGTPTDLPPSKERQYHIDTYNKTSKSKALNKAKKGAYDITRGYDKSYRKENPSFEPLWEQYKRIIKDGRKMF